MEESGTPSDMAWVAFMRFGFSSDDNCTFSNENLPSQHIQHEENDCNSHNVRMLEKKKVNSPGSFSGIWSSRKHFVETGNDEEINNHFDDPDEPSAPVKPETQPPPLISDDTDLFGSFHLSYGNGENENSMFQKSNWSGVEKKDLTEKSLNIPSTQDTSHLNTSVDKEVCEITGEYSSKKRRQNFSTSLYFTSENKHNMDEKQFSESVHFPLDAADRARKPKTYNTKCSGSEFDTTKISNTNLQDYSGTEPNRNFISNNINNTGTILNNSSIIDTKTDGVNFEIPTSSGSVLDVKEKPAEEDRGTESALCNITDRNKNRYTKIKTNTKMGNNQSMDYLGKYYRNYTSPSSYYPINTRSMEDFAIANQFEVYDVEYDGNCMFRSVEDQLRINSIFCHTARSLRKRAVSYLRDNPKHDDGSHLESFLEKESWEQYLVRMQRKSEWGDHLVLKALAESLRTSIVIFNVTNYDDVRRLELQPKIKGPTTESEEKPIYLGHIGEYHYVSLRPAHWEQIWPLQAKFYRNNYLIHRTMVGYVSTKLTIFENIKKIRFYKQQIAANREAMKRMLTQLAKKEQTTEQDVDEEPRAMAALENETWEYKDEEDSENFEKELQQILSNDITRILPVDYSCPSTQKDDTQDSLRLLVDDPRLVDPVSGVPSPHLSFALRTWIQEYMEETVIDSNPTLSDGSYLSDADSFSMFPQNSYNYRSSGITVEYSGISIDRTNVKLKDIARKRNVEIYPRPWEIPISIICDSDHEVKFKGDSKVSDYDVILDESKTHPGYCRLRPRNPSEEIWQNQLWYEGEDVYVKPEQIDMTVLSRSVSKRVYKGFCSKKWIPAANEWLSRDRPSKWPTPEMKEKIIQAGILFIHHPHRQSKLREVEWKYLFSRAEKEIFRNCLTKQQMNVFKIFKILVDYQCRHLKYCLAPGHIKSIFLRAVEVITEEKWELSVGGCLLYLVAILVDCLRKRTIPNYFISQFNMIDHFAEKEIDFILAGVEALRNFPMEVLRFCTERHGIPMKMTTIVRDIEFYSEEKNLQHAVEYVFVPILQEYAKNHANIYDFVGAQHYLEHAYNELTLMAKILNDPSAIPEFGTFVIESMGDCAETVQFKVQILFEEKLGKKLRDLPESTVYVKNLVDGEEVSEFAEMPVPESYLGNKGSEAQLLEDIVILCYNMHQDDDALFYIRKAIDLLKRALREDIVDVSDIEDVSLKAQIGRKNTFNISAWSNQLHKCYIKLLQCCKNSGKLEIMREYMPEIEMLAERLPAVKPFVESTWLQLEPNRWKMSYKNQGALGASYKNQYNRSFEQDYDMDDID